jgi:hypothetical protein
MFVAPRSSTPAPNVSRVDEQGTGHELHADHSDP